MNKRRVWCRTSGARPPALDPALPGWADFWCRPSGPGLQTPPSHVHSSLNLPQVSRSAAEGSAVPRNFPGNAESHPATNLSSRPERSGVERSAVSFSFSQTLKPSSKQPISVVLLSKLLSDHEPATRRGGRPACSHFPGALPPQASTQTV
jgi:hypothetical protein